MKIMPTPHALSGLAVLLAATLPLASSHAASAYAVKPGPWDSDIWSAKAGGPPTPGLRPGQGDYDSVQFRQGGVVVAVRTDVGSFSQLYLNNVSGAAVLKLNGSGRLDVKFLALSVGGNKSLVEVTDDAVLTVGETGVRVAHTEKGTGTFNIIDGSVTVAGKFIISSKNASGTVNLSGGSLSVPFIETGTGTSAFVWEGGVLQASGCDLAKLENTGQGVLDIGGTSTVNGAFTHEGTAPVYQQGPDATMRVEIESAKSHDSFASEGASGEVILNGTLEVHLLKDYRPRSGEQFEIISAAKITDEGLKLGGPAGASCQFEIVPKGSGQVLRLTFR